MCVTNVLGVCYYISDQHFKLTITSKMLGCKIKPRGAMKGHQRNNMFANFLHGPFICSPPATRPRTQFCKGQSQWSKSVLTLVSGDWVAATSLENHGYMPSCRRTRIPKKCLLCVTEVPCWTALRPWVWRYSLGLELLLQSTDSTLGPQDH